MSDQDAMSHCQIGLDRFLVVGADSHIGASLVSFLELIGADVTGTTRRKETANGRRLFLDLSNEDDMVLPVGRYDCMFLCAGIASLAACEDDPQGAYRVNVTNMLRLANRFHGNGGRTVFLSSNAVFNGKSVRPDEHSEYCASTEYGRQKALAESGLMALAGDTGSIAILRLTKVLSSMSGVAAEFVRQLKDGKPCRAFDNLLMSPVSLEYVLNALVKIASNKLSGVFHLSGAEEMSYAEFACRLAVHMNVNPSLVRRCSSADVDVTALFQPEHPALGMTRTINLLGIGPQSSAQLLNKLIARND
jgi:dTDP-4-dehydrorhamnose reductase